MNNKKIIKVIIISLFILIFLGVLIYLIIDKDNSNTSNNNISSITKSDIENIDWSTYDSEEITLTKSVEITKEGVYKLTGTISNGYIYINTEGNVKLVLNNVTIINNSGPAIYIENAKSVEINTVKETTNILSDGTTYNDFEEDVNGCIYSKDDLILSGDGSLKVTGNYEDGIVSKDDLKIINGTYIINTKNNGIKGKDSIEIENGTFNITSVGDAITVTNDTDKDKGYVLIENGSFTIKTTGNPDSSSSKGIKATNQVIINNGTFNIDSTDDSIHSDGTIKINNGTYTLSSKEDGIHADGMIEINNGTFSITASEGIEATYIKINDGDITISATDDGINASNKSSDYTITVEINGGNITIKMGAGDTDAIDSNGNLYINGGKIDITANSSFDYDGKAEYNGGTIIVNGNIVNSITNQMMGGGMKDNMPQDGNIPQNGRRMR